MGFIYKDELAERRLKSGDVYRIPAGSAFYLVNTGEGQRLQIICSIDTSESLGLGLFQVLTSPLKQKEEKYLFRFIIKITTYLGIFIRCL